VSVEAEHFDNKTVGDNGDEWVEIGPTGLFTGIAAMQVQPDDNTGSRNTNYAARSARLDFEINTIIVSPSSTSEESIAAGEYSFLTWPEHHSIKVE